MHKGAVSRSTHRILEALQRGHKESGFMGIPCYLSPAIFCSVHVLDYGCVTPDFLRFSGRAVERLWHGSSKMLPSSEVFTFSGKCACNCLLNALDDATPSSRPVKTLLHSLVVVLDGSAILLRLQSGGQGAIASGGTSSGLQDRQGSCLPKGTHLHCSHSRTKQKKAEPASTALSSPTPAKR